MDCPLASLLAARLAHMGEESCREHHITNPDNMTAIQQAGIFIVGWDGEFGDVKGLRLADEQRRVPKREA